MSLRHLLLAMLASAFCASAVAAPGLTWQPDTATGPLGKLVLKADLPGQASPVSVVVSQYGKPLDTLSLVKGSDSLFQATLPFRQGSKPATTDTAWLGAVGRTTDSLVASLVSGGVTYKDTARVKRAPLGIKLTQKGISDSLQVTLTAGAQANAQGKRTVTFLAGTAAISMHLSQWKGDTSLTSLLLSATQMNWIRGEGWIRVRFVDPIYRDTVMDSILVAIPSRSLSAIPDTITGPRGGFIVWANDPWEAGSTLTLRVVSGKDTIPVQLPRVGSGTYHDTIFVTQARTASGDTLVLGPPKPAGAHARIVLLMPKRDPMPVMADTVTILRPPLALKLSHVAGSATAIEAKLQGEHTRAPDSAKVYLESWATPSPRLVPMRSLDSLRWEGATDFLNQVQEWYDSIPMIGYAVDPIYGDTARDTIRFATPWYPATLRVLPQKANPRMKSTVTLNLQERDPDSTRFDSLVVTSNGTRTTLIETARNSGIFAAKIISSELDPNWILRPPRTPWDLNIRYQDPRHPDDTTHATLTMDYDVPFFEMSTYRPIARHVTGGRSSNPSGRFGIELVKQPGYEFSPYHDAGQGVALRVWDRTHMLIFIYDNLGSLVCKWEGDAIPNNGDQGALFLIRWDGRDTNGRPAPRGVYIVRALAQRPDGVRAIAQLTKIGLN